MVKNVQITLYEIFGYFLPGVVATSAVGILFWSCFYPDAALPLQRVPFEIWAAAGIIAYFVGHLTHAVADLFLGRPENKALDAGPSSATPEDIPSALREVAPKKAAEMMSVNPEQINNALLFSICDETLAQSGEIGDREIYQYRGGFYKGMTVSFVLLVLGGLFRIFHSTTFLFKGEVQTVSRGEVAFGLAIVVIAAFFFGKRYRWFATHRVRRALLGFLIVRESRPMPGAPRSDGT
jgi:hypothetical protein